MTQYDNTNRGIISKNDRKGKKEHPDITGTINVEGREFWLSGWHKNRKDGTGAFYSLSVKPKDQGQQSERQEKTEGHFEDDLPF